MAVALLLAFGVGLFVAAEEPASLSEVFEARYQHLLQQVQAGELPQEIKAQAKAVWLALRKDIIALDAEVETLKLEVVSQQGSSQEAALDELGAITAQRERRLIKGIQDLDRLAGGEISALPLVPAVVPAASPSSGERREVGTPKQEQDPEKTKTKIWDIEIEFAPEDLSKGDME